MNISRQISLGLLSVLLLAACHKNEDHSEETWRQANEQAYNVVAKDPVYTELPSLSNNGSIYYRVLHKGSGTKPIYYTSRVEVYYKGWFVAGYPEKNIHAGDIGGRRLYDDGAPLTFPVNDAGLIEGWRVALQYMVEGDKWEIWIPSKLNYVQSAYNSSHYPAFAASAPAYATLAYEIEVVRVRGIDEL
ncbi:MAG: FKBP-type peptidyl-prolyl cis-trans isomerase [Tannerella sp.]|jgi:peptidylprolyl isomerase/FKBP-type peptidyl-prolyl cis-trans isomerase FklB|nr:FKBP-type peptidyl-prolyl cis-trans isomerase [Tannerella sp.]